MPNPPLAAAPPAEAMPRDAAAPATAFAVTPLPMPELGALAYSLCPTPAEFLALCDDPGVAILRRRITEARIPADVQVELVHYPHTVNFLALVGIGLPDTVVLLPLWMRMANAMPRAMLRVVDERALPMLERLLGNDDDLDIENMELPMLLVLDEEWHYQGRWGPRPAAAEALLDGWLVQHPEYEVLAEMDDADSTDADHAAWDALTEALMLEMRIWYNSGLDADATREILALLALLLESHEPLEHPAETEADS
jgi:hypothetical protein